MSTTEGEKKNALQEALRAVPFRFFEKEGQLARYERYQLRSYIEHCCEHSYLIEAYSLTVQYVEDLIFYSVAEPGDKDLDARYAPKTILEVLHKLNLVTDEFHNKYKDVNNRRNKLAHKVMKNPEIRKELSNDKSHLQLLIDLVTLAEDFLIGFVRSHRKLFVRLFTTGSEDLSQKQKERRDFIIQIIMNKTTVEIASLYDGDEVRFRRLLMDTFWKKFQYTTGLVGKDGISS